MSDRRESPYEQWERLGNAGVYPYVFTTPPEEVPPVSVSCVRGGICPACGLAHGLIGTTDPLPQPYSQWHYAG